MPSSGSFCMLCNLEVHKHLCCRHVSAFLLLGPRLTYNIVCKLEAFNLKQEMAANSVVDIVNYHGCKKSFALNHTLQ